MAEEEQTQHDSLVGLSGQEGGKVRAGQKKTISNSSISKLAFPIYKLNNPTGNVTFNIRRVSNDASLGSKVWGDASALSVSVVWEEVTFDSPVAVNEEVRLLVEFSNEVVENQVAYRFYGASSIKADENFVWYVTGWSGENDQDGAYRYTYTGLSVPVVSTQANTSTIAQGSIGYGTLLDIGTSAVTQHGHCWNTSANPTTSHSKTEKGAKANLGQFDSILTGLTPGTLYYVRAYATNGSGTGYGANVEITTASTIGRRYWWVEGKEFHYFDEYGAERKVEGIPDTSGLPWWYGYRF